MKFVIFLGMGKFMKLCLLTEMPIEFSPLEPLEPDRKWSFDYMPPVKHFFFISNILDLIGNLPRVIFKKNFLSKKKINHLWY